MTEQTILSQPTTTAPAKGKKVVVKPSDVNGFHAGSAPISEEALELVNEYRKAAKDIKPFDVLKKTAQGLIEAEMLEKGVNELTHNGVVEVAENFVQSKKVDWEGLLAEFPGAVKYITNEWGTRFDAKK